MANHIISQNGTYTAANNNGLHIHSIAQTTGYCQTINLPLGHYQEQMQGHATILDSTTGATWTLNNNGEQMTQPIYNLWEVYVVDQKKEVLLDKKVVATDAEDARHAAGVDLLLRKAGLRPSEVTIFTAIKGVVKVAAPKDKEES